MCKKSKIRCGGLIYFVCLVLLLGLAITSVGNAARPNPVAWWKFDGDALDSSGNGHNGTLMGDPAPGFVEGMFGQALDTTISGGNPEYVEITGYKGIAGSIPFSITAWIKTTDGGGVIVAWGRDNSGSDANRFEFRTNSNRLRVEHGDGNLEGDTSVTDDEWHHVATTKIENGTMQHPDTKIYLDGEDNTMTSTGDDSITNLTENTYDLTIARRHTSGRWFDALIDDVRIYDRELTQAEVQEVMEGIGPLPPGLAFEPGPDREVTDVPRDVVLSWKPGKYAAPVNGHKVYFGQSFNDINDATGAVAQTAASYALPRLDFGRTYYWRVDEVNAPPTGHIEFKGEVWSFTTEPIAYAIEDVNATASSSMPTMGPENTVNDSGMDANDLHSTLGTDMWVSTSDPNGAWIEFEFDRVYKLREMWVWNSNQMFEPTIGFGCKGVTIEYSADGNDYATLGTTGEFAQAPGTPGYAHNTTIDFGGVAAKNVRITVNSNWGFMTQYSLSEVRFLYIPVRAREPQPASGATDVDVDVVLNWRTGREAAEHNVYISTDEQAVIDSNVPVSIVTEAQDGPLSLDLVATYYWKVNEVNMAETPTMLEGDVWNLTTTDSLVVDGFEDYNDWPGHRVYEKWSDGWEIPTNGATIGYPEPLPVGGHILETTNFHGGKQALPFFYDNTTAASSEATVNVAELTIGTDWTGNGVKSLSLWFRSDPNNSAEQMYVKLNGVKVLYDSDASNLSKAGWHPWNINLPDFTGVDLSNVTELIIGFERGAGGTGKVLFDDIRLYPFERQLITSAEPNNANLAAYWQLDGNFNDSSGNGLHGIAMGEPIFVAGNIGQAISLDGVDDYVEITGYKGILGPNAVTVTAWVKTSSMGTENTGTDSTNAIVGWGPDVGGQRFGFRVNDGRIRTEHHGGNVQGDTIMADGRWHHVAVTVKENVTISYPDVILYLDGFDDTRPSRDPDAYDITADLDVRIGSRPASGDRFFMGQIDDVRIYDYALSRAEVAWLAGVTVPFDKPF